MPQKTFFFVPIGSHGDVHPIVGIALAMKARGHRVIVGTNGFFRELVERNGIEFVEFGTAEDYLEVTSKAEVWDPQKGSQIVLGTVARQLQPIYYALLQRWRQEKFTLVASPLCMAARLLHETHAVPLISTHLQPIAMRSAYEMPGMPISLPEWTPQWVIRALFWLADVTLLDPAIAPALNAFRQELTLPPVRRVTARWWNSPQRVIGLWPEWFAKPQPDWPRRVQLAGFPLYDERGVTEMPQQLEEFLAAGSAPIAFTPGSAMRQGRAFFEAAIGACEKLGRRGVLLTRFSEHLPDNLPANVMHVSFVPFSLLLPRCAALVHHGGIGTMAQGFAAGIPQLIMPMAHDQPDNLLRLQRLGAGDGLAPKHFKAPAVAAKLQALLGDEQVLARCRELQQLISTAHPLDTACELLEANL
ncbi:MAG: nucleotide disphospho-sugar-binding domain-containing protein [Pseudomonadota bacterium]